MKKNLFLLVSFYLFVVQIVFVGIVRSEARFYWLALGNFVFILFIAIFSKSNDVDGAVQEPDRSLNNLEKVSVMRNKSDFKIHHIWMFIISLLFGILLFFWLGDTVVYLKILFSVASACVLFVLGGLLLHYKPFQIWSGKLLFISLILALGWGAISFLGINLGNLGLSESHKDNVFVSGVINDFQIVNTGKQDDTALDIPGSGFLSGLQQTGTENNVDLNSIENKDLDLDKMATFSDVIKSLLSGVQLNTKTNVSFKYISKSDIDYPYYRSAYEKKMIGTDLDPNKNLLCETYLVMKGLAEGWTVGAYTDIKKAYWQYAKQNSLLPACKYGAYVKIGDLGFNR